MERRIVEQNLQRFHPRREFPPLSRPRPPPSAPPRRGHLLRMNYLRVKNWEEFQHYKDRNPPWIKLHRTLLDDYEFSRLQDASKAHLILIWLFASQKNGRIPDDPGFLKKKLGLEQEPDLKFFVNQGLLIPVQVASTVLAGSKQVAPRVEKRTKATDIAPSGAFLRFWAAWPRSPRKQSRGPCWDRWRKSDLDLVAEQILAHVEAMKFSIDWRKDAGAFIPSTLVYLNQRRWDGADLSEPNDSRRVAMP